MPDHSSPLPNSLRRLADALSADLRFAFRYFARHKGTTAVIVAVIALGTGANTLIFSIFQSEFLRPAPAVSDAGQSLIWGQQRSSRAASWQPRGFTQPELAALAGQRAIFQGVAGWTDEEVILGGDSTAARSAGAQFVTPNYFGVLGLTLAAGPGFRQDDGDGADLVAVMAHRMATQLFGSAEAAVGRNIRVNDVPVRIVGIAPVRFQGALRNMHEPAVWLPVSARAQVARVSPRWLTEQSALSLVARLAPGASHQQATAFARHVVTAALPDSAERVGMARTADVQGLTAPPPGEERAQMILAVIVMGSIGGLILLVAWTNVSSLMVAAAVSRRHEIAVRLSLGASRPRLLRQLVTESTLLAVVGGAIGLTLAWLQLNYMTKTEIDGVNIMPDPATFAFVLALAVGTGILFGLSPALHATKSGVGNALRDSGSGASSRSRLQRGFVVAQIALSQPLLVLLATTLSLVIGEFRPLEANMSRHVINVGVRPLANGGPGQRAEAVDSLIPRIAERPEVLGAVPEASAFALRAVTVTGPRQPGDTVPTIVHEEAAAPGWFAVVGVPIILGRDVELADTAAVDHPVVISSDLARALWGNENPLGRTLASPPLHDLDQKDSIALTVVGVYDASQRLPGMAWQSEAARSGMTEMAKRVFTAHGKQWSREAILVRTRGAAEPFVPELQKLLREQAPGLPVTSMLTLAQADEAAYKETLQVSALAGAGGLLALLLSSLGLYGVVSLAVRQRTREIGIRIAVGAAPMRVARGFLASGVRVSLLALGLGLPLSIAGLKIGMTQGVVIAPNVNPWLIGAAIALVLLAVASAATWVPARRAALVDPARTLRVE